MKLIIKTNIFSLLMYLFTCPLFSSEGELQDQIEKKVASYFDGNNIPGMAVGIIGKESKGAFQKIMTYGNVSKKGFIPVNSETEFQIGSLTQIFTAAILAYYVEEGTVSLDDPISKFFPKSIKMPTFEGVEITLKNLATHTSGLPDMPYSPAGFSTFGHSEMFRFLTQYQLKTKPGSAYEPSHLGYALLANVLMRVGKRPFREVLQEILLTPLALVDTRMTLTREQKTRRAIGYENESSSPSNEKIFSVFTGSIGLYATPLDMLKFLSFLLGNAKSNLTPILSLMQFPYYTFRSFETGLGWLIKPLHDFPDISICVNSGTSGGFSSYFAISHKTGAGVFILSNEADLRLDFFGEEIMRLLTHSTD